MITRYSLGFFAIVCGALATSLAWSQTPGTSAAIDPVVVSLKREAHIDGKLVRIENIAMVNYGPAKLRELVERLDLAEITDPNEPIVITREIVRFRMLVAGIDPDAFRISGTQKTIVRRVGIEKSSAATPEQPSLIRPVKNDTKPVVENPVIVKNRDRVRLMAHLGSSAVIAVGEAQQDGRLGQSIRVRNVDSNKIVQGLVSSPGVVDVDY